METLPILNSAKTFNSQTVRADFPILQTEVRGKPLTYLDNAATAQKPRLVLDALDRYYAAENSNIHRGVHYLSEMATDAYEATRAKLAGMPTCRIRMRSFYRGATESINLIAHGFTETILQAGDEILITHMEHHANIVPWQIACQRTGAELKVVPVDDDGVLDMEAFTRALRANKARLCGSLLERIGYDCPIKEIVAQAHALNVPVLVMSAERAA